MGKEENVDGSFNENDEEARCRSKEEEAANKVDPETGLKARQIEEILLIPATNHSGIQLVSAQLTGSNFLNWSKSIKRALAARSKMELIDGTFRKPNAESVYYKRWLKVDYMVSTWITNSISKEFVDAFSNIDNREKLWSALVNRFGTKNGPKILKLHRDIYSFRQGNQSVFMYFNQLNSYWDEMDMLLPPLDCVCQAKGKSIQRQEQMRLVAFLAGLNDVYEHTKTQILLQQPWPTLDQAYAMVVQVEDQKQLNDASQEVKGVMTMNVNNQVYVGPAQNTDQKPSYQKQYQGPYKRRMSKEEKRKQKCSYCQEMGHEKDECFKLHGVPEWFKKLKEQRSQGQYRANYVESNRKADGGVKISGQKDNNNDMSKLIQSELMKYMGQMFQHKQPGGSAPTKAEANMLHDATSKPNPFDGHFAFSVLPSMHQTDWVIDSGASTHICANPELMYTTYQMDAPTVIYLPDGSSKTVIHAGKVRLNADNVLDHVLYVPGFTHNLLSVPQLAKSMDYKCVFHPTHCLIQQGNTDKVVGIGKLVGNLYVMDTVNERHYLSFYNPHDMTIEDWHIIWDTHLLLPCLI